jgi:hypothetical protein
MPQISLYIDKETLAGIGRKARKNRLSISRWVGNHLKKLVMDDYPDGYFSLFGSIKESSVERPEPIDYSHDNKREEL